VWVRVERTSEKEIHVTVIVTGRHMDVTEPLKAFATEKMSKLTKFLDTVTEIDVIFDAAGKLEIGVEVLVHAEHRSAFVAKVSNADAYAGIDLCYGKLERQLTEHKEKQRNRKHPH
jgi:putative sigma-54 modulation protein